MGRLEGVATLGDQRGQPSLPLPTRRSWRSQLEGEGRGGPLRASQQGARWSGKPVRSRPRLLCWELLVPQGEARGEDRGAPLPPRLRSLEGDGEDEWTPGVSGGTRVGRAGVASRKEGCARPPASPGVGVALGAAGVRVSLAAAEGQGHPELARRRPSSLLPSFPPSPRLGAPSRALIGAAAAAGRVSAASLRDATPSNCGRDRRYAAASCPGARPGPARPRPASRPLRPAVRARGY